MTAPRDQGSTELFSKLQRNGTATSGHINQAEAEQYQALTAAGTASPQKPGVSQSLAEMYHKLSGT